MSLFRTAGITCLSILFAPLCFATNVSGTISTSTTWTAAGNPYIVTGTVTVASAATLTIDPGVIVKFNSGTGLEVNGRLLAVGTSASGITFTTNAATPARGGWRAINLNGGTNAASQIAHATISWAAGSAIGYAFRVYTGSADLDHVTVTESASVGIYARTPGAVSFNHVTVSNCTSHGMRIEGNGAQTGLYTISNSVINANGGHGINFFADGRASITGTAITNNTGYAIGAQPHTDLQGMTGLTVTGNGSGAKNVIEYRGGTISARDETWRGTIPWHVLTNTNVGAGRLLTVEPGAVVRFVTSMRLNVLGRLLAQGTAAAGITFTSTAAAPARGAWHGLDLAGPLDAPSTLAYVTVSYAGTTLGSAVRIHTSSATLDHVTVTESSTLGISARTTGTLTMTNLTVSNCTSHGLSIQGTSGVQTGLYAVSSSTFSGNGGYGINFGPDGQAVVTDSTFVNNVDYAIGAQAETDLQGLTGLSASGNGSGTKNAIGYRGGSIDARDEVWRVSDAVPYVVLSSTSVGEGRLLTIAEGSTVKFGSAGVLLVDGRLAAVGTPLAPINLTSTTAPGAGTWRGLEFNGTPTVASALKYVNIAYAGESVSGNSVRILAGAPELDHVTISSSSSGGIYTRTSGAPVLSFVTVTNCTGSGIKVDAFGGPSGLLAISDSTFSSNGRYGIEIMSSGRATAIRTAFIGNALGGANALFSTDLRMCYWGAASGPGGAGGGGGQSVNTNVSFEPWLTSTPVTEHRFGTYSIVNRTFNPDIATSWKGSFSTADVADWTVSITDSAGNVVRNWAGSGIATGELVWDGRDTAGVLQADGTYFYQIDSTHTGNAVAIVARGRVLVSRAKALTLTALARSAEFFSSNGDAINETVTFTAATNYDDSTWTVLIKNAAGTTVRTVPGSGSAVAFAWDGMDDAAAPVADGVYTAEAVAVAGTATVTRTIEVTLDATAPTAQIAAPTAAQLLSNMRSAGVADVSVTGTIADVHLLSWTLDYALAPALTTWEIINSGTAPIAAAQIGVWQTLPLTNGSYELRLRVTDRAGTTATYVVMPHVGNFRVQNGKWELNTNVGGTIPYISSIPFPVTQTLTIEDEMGTVVRTLVNGVSRSTGSYTDYWNGRNDLGEYLPDGPYFYYSTVTDGTDTLDWDLSTKFRADDVQAFYPTFTGTFDPFNNAPLPLKYSLSTPWRVSIQVGGRGYFYGPSCSQFEGTVCLTEWEYKSSGSHTYNWWGTRPSGAFLPGKGGANIIIRHDNFPNNAVVLFGTAPKVTSVRVTPAKFNPAANTPAVNSPNAGTQSVEITLTSPRPLEVKLQFLNQESMSVLRTITLTEQWAGTITVPWDGRAGNGMWVAPGFYTVVITATDDIGNATRQHAVMHIQY